jgi:hypothetical protein
MEIQDRDGAWLDSDYASLQDLKDVKAEIEAQLDNGAINHPDHNSLMERLQDVNDAITDKEWNR